jgi:Immune inhibitor A-like, MAM domain
VRTRLIRTAAVAGALSLAFAGVAPAGADPGDSRGGGNSRTEVKQTGTDYNKGKKLPLRVSPGQPVPGTQHSKNARVGDKRAWLALDDVYGLYVKTYTLRGVGEHIEIWVADELAFPAGDCRNTVDNGALVTITDAQVRSFVDEFDTNMYPKESAAFSVAPDRDGSKAVLDNILSDKTASKKKGDARIPSSYYVGDGAKTVTLVDNVRDANFYDPSSPDGQTYIAGFFYSVFNEYVDRNVMTIDSYDWLHRTGPEPGDDSADPEYRACAEQIGAPAVGRSNPFLYEGTFAHEYQHLLEYYADTDEVSWVNEGLSDWAQTLTGYVNPAYLPDDDAADSHIACFQGYLPASYGGPENSLTLWGDQGGPEILCDYGAAYTFFEYLHGRFDGDAFMSALHREPANGLAGLDAVLDQFGHSETAQEVIHDWLAMVALDETRDPGNVGTTDVLTSPTLRSMVNWDNPQAYESDGAPPNGADFVAGGGSVTFRGDTTYPGLPSQWTSDGSRLFSGAGDDLDSSIVFSADVPAADPTLNVTMEWGTELGWDFAFVQVWDDGAGKWVSLADQQGMASSAHDPGAIAAVVDNLPGFSGPSPNADATSGPQALTFDLSEYAGLRVDLAFRYITDPAVEGPGFWVDEATIGGSTITDGSSAVDAKSISQVHPAKVAGWTVQVVDYAGTGDRQFLELTLEDGAWVGTAEVPGTGGLIITPDDPTETQGGYPRYLLE